MLLAALYLLNLTIIKSVNLTNIRITPKYIPGIPLLRQHSSPGRLVTQTLCVVVSAGAVSHANPRKLAGKTQPRAEKKQINH